jgi:hypothetical protein
VDYLANLKELADSPNWMFDGDTTMFEFEMEINGKWHLR